MMKKKLKPALFYILSCTWGLGMNAIGVLVSIVMVCCGKRPKQNIYGWYFEVGEKWGGLDFGLASLVNKNPNEHILRHEFGHAVQNCYFGPFMFIIWIASATRYQYRNIMKKRGKELPPYDSIWFEGQATELGTIYDMQ